MKFPRSTLALARTSAYVIVTGLAIGAFLGPSGCSEDTTEPPPVEQTGVRFVADHTTVSEMTRAVSVHITRDAGLADTTEVLLRLSAGSATSADFSGGTRRMRMGVGETGDTLAVFVTPDSTAEADETFAVAIESASNGAEVGEPRTLTVTITDLANDFTLTDVNPNSATLGTMISPRNKLQRLSAWYFGHAT